MSDIERGNPHIEQEKQPCVFCEIKDGKRHASIVSEDDKTIVFIALEGHPLVVPKEHITRENIVENADIMGEAYRLAVALIPAVEAGLGATGVNLVTNLGSSAGQEVEHAHIHILDRNMGDRKLRFAPGGTLSRQVLDARAELIRQKIV